MTTHHHNIGDKVAFKCYVNGPVKGTIKRIKPCITNGQSHAEIELLPPFPAGCFVLEPMINLIGIA